MRSYLKEGTWVRLPGGECYKITGTPIGEGGGSLIYPVVKQIYTNESGYKSSELKYALKECYPVSSEYSFIRTDSGEIVPESAAEQSEAYLNTVQKMQMEEEQITGKVYNTGFRLTPILSGSVGVELSMDNGKNFVQVRNTVTVMESLSNKGHSLKSYLMERKILPAVQAFRIIEQVLFAVREVHNAGYLHLDIQDGNVFLKGQLSDSSDFASLIDFGSSRQLLDDGLCASIEDRVIFSTQGFAAPEMSYKNDGTLRLGPEADIYSIGYLLLLLLTGQKYSPYELYSNTNGHYLTKFKLRKINCPKHLVERMQQILANALENEPERRYHSCDEMLADVSDFVKALQPYRSDLSQVMYDAFICYKHGPVDSNVAKILQESLEHFHVSRILGENRRRIKRVFVDEGELSSCSDFGLQIREALRNTGWLIVICSPETKNSPWVNLEIKTFLEFHDRSRILAVMTSGEPAEIFPDALLGKSGNTDEVLAADARGQDLSEVRKKLKKDTLFRIVAPILGVTYDSLKQRHRVYRIQRIAMGLSVALALFLVFTLYTLQQSAQINKQYQQSRKNQARYLSSISTELWNSGDRNKALLTALAIEPEDDMDGPVVPEQMYALNSALTSYKSGLTVDYDPAYVGEAEGVTYGVLSLDEKYYYAIDQNNNVQVLSGENGKLQWMITPEEIKESVDDIYRYSESEDFNEIRLVLPLLDDKIAVGLAYSMAVIDVETREIVNTFPLDSYITLNSLVYDQKGELFAFANMDGELFVYNLNTGEKTYYLELNADSDSTLTKYTVNSISFNEDNTSVALGLSYEYVVKDNSSQIRLTTAEERVEHREHAKEYFSEHPALGLIVYNLDNQKMSVVSNVQTQKVLFTDNSHIAAIHFTNPVSGTELEDRWGSSNYSYYSSLYDITSREQLFTGETITIRATSNIGLLEEQLEINNREILSVIIWIRGSLTVVNMVSGSVLAEITYSSDVIGVSAYDDYRLFIGLNDGTVQMLVLDGKISRYKILSLSANTNQYIFNKTMNEIILISNSRVLFCNNEADREMSECSTSDFTLSDMKIKDIHYVEVAGNSYRYLCMYQEYSDICSFAVFPTNSNECIYQYQSEKTNSDITNIGFGYDQGNIYVSFVEEWSDEQTIFIKANITTGETVIKDDVTAYDSLRFTYNSLFYSSDMNTMFVERQEGVVRFDISGDTLVPDSRAIIGTQKIDEMKLTGNGKYLVLVTKDNSADERKVYIYSLQDERLHELNIEMAFTSEYVSDFLIPGQSSSYMCLYDGGEVVYVVDCETDSVISIVDVDNGDDYNLAFFDNDKYLILVNSNIVTLYDLNQGKTTYTYTTSIKTFGTKVITDSSNHYFALRDASISESTQYDTGITSQPLYIFYVDDNHQFYQYATIDYGYASLSGEEISVVSANRYTYAQFYDYSYLKNQALKVLDGQTLTPQERQEYFIME